MKVIQHKHNWKTNRYTSKTLIEGPLGTHGIMAGYGRDQDGPHIDVKIGDDVPEGEHATKNYELRMTHDEAVRLGKRILDTAEAFRAWDALQNVRATKP